MNKSQDFQLTINERDLAPYSIAKGVGWGCAMGHYLNARGVPWKNMLKTDIHHLVVDGIIPVTEAMDWGIIVPNDNENEQRSHMEVDGKAFRLSQAAGAVIHASDSLTTAKTTYGWKGQTLERLRRELVENFRLLGTELTLIPSNTEAES